MKVVWTLAEGSTQEPGRAHDHHDDPDRPFLRKQVHRTDRRLANVLELQGRGHARTEDLARTLDGSRRTIGRDVPNAPLANSTATRAHWTHV
ncbi:hypothetical protein [Deinococcus pimensis]|uniref:hypothetical protein n=1 Tax=Deinococcus pimensis TaxID=309888 RepID=UPI0012F9DEE7|nr:hypothetical protein [Deinococcus pimensis]